MSTLVGFRSLCTIPRSCSTLRLCATDLRITSWSSKSRAATWATSKSSATSTFSVTLCYFAHHRKNWSVAMRLPPRLDEARVASMIRRWCASNASHRARFFALIFSLPGALSSGYVGLRNSLKKYSRPSLAANVHLLKPAPATLEVLQDLVSVDHVALVHGVPFSSLASISTSTTADGVTASSAACAPGVLSSPVALSSPAVPAGGGEAAR